VILVSDSLARPSHLPADEPPRWEDTIARRAPPRERDDGGPVNLVEEDIRDEDVHL
jgi:hypothetical protein